MSEIEVIDRDEFLQNIKWNADGLVPAIIQDKNDGTVLMLGYMNEQSLNLTFTKRKVTFWSRSRQTLWTKGETSGNFLELVDIFYDCDGDAILVKADPKGPTCHTGKRTCFSWKSD
jgi:phosphoribosyl-ATP pyrophosphohydrolase/phosphoribosyl-AMP cyclohydrolase